ncbi:MAG: hypothetical protein ACI31R_04755 [Bacilli bacterium]
MEKSKTNKGLVVMVVILSIALIGAIGYICYDKFMVKEDLKQEETPKEEKLSEEEVKKLHESLISKSGEHGFYYNRKVSIDEIPYNKFLQFAIADYLDENNIKFDLDNSAVVCGDYSSEYYICDSETEKKVKESVTDKMTISKDKITAYIKERFNTDRNFVLDDEPIGVTATNNALWVYYNSDKKEYYFVVPHHGWPFSKIYSKMLKYEQNKDEIVIYDKALIGTSCEDYGFLCETMIYADPTDNYDNVIFSSGDLDTIKDKNGKNIPNGEKYVEFNEGQTIIHEEAIFEDFDSELNTFKHTFKKASDGKYYWYSSEIVNE